MGGNHSKEDEPHNQAPKQRIQGASLLQDLNKNVSNQPPLLQVFTSGVSPLPYLDLDDIRNLVIVSKQFFTFLAPRIESTFYFNVFLDESFAIYNPQKLIIYAQTSWDRFPHVTHIIFSHAFNSSIEGLPATITHLRFGSLFKQPVDNLLPPALTHLSFKEQFNHPITHFPPALKSLAFSHDSMFTHPIDIPPSVTHLTIHRLRNVTLPPSLKYFHLAMPQTKLPLPNSVTELTLSNFGDPVDGLLPNLTSISLGTAFNQPLNNLPASLQKLTTGTMFNQPVDNLPSSLKTLILGQYFNQPLLNLPASLLKLKFYFYNCAFNESILFPPNLKSLCIPSSYKRKDLPPLPSTIRVLNIQDDAICNIPTLPPLLDTLHAQGDFLRQLKSFPSSLHRMFLRHPFEGPLTSVPPSCSVTVFLDDLKTLSDLPANMHHNVKSICLLRNTYVDYQYSLKQFTSVVGMRLTFYNYCLPQLPPNLRSLECAMDFNHSVDSIPASIQRLVLGDRFNQTVDELPAGLRILHLGDMFNQPVDKLPAGLRQLVMTNKRYSCKLDRIPLSLVELVVSIEPGSPIYQTIPPSLLPITFPFTYCPTFDNVPY